MANSSLRKAAVFLLSLPNERAADLLGRLDPQQAAAVTAEMASVGEVDGAEQTAVKQEFSETRVTEPADQMPDSTAPFHFLYDLDADALLDLIADEHPQTIALILSCLPSRQAAEALGGLTPEGQLSVVCRIALMGEPEAEIVRDVEQGLQRRMLGETTEVRSEPGVANLVRMLHAMEPASERKLLGRLAETAPELVREIRRAMFGVDAVPCDERATAGVA